MARLTVALNTNHNGAGEAGPWSGRTSSRSKSNGRSAVPDLISVIETTYEREDALDAVLRSLARQSDRRFEVIVADDGSGPATAALIERSKQRLGVPLAHVWQEHRDFRAAEMRNRALLAAHGDYCVFLDGD